MNAAKNRRRGRIQLVAVVVVCVLPFVGALLATQLLPQFGPFGTANHGTLVEPLVPVGVSELAAADSGSVGADTFAGKWSLVMFADADCPEGCRERLYLTQQVRLLLNKDADRVQRLLVLPSKSRRDVDVEGLVASFPGLRVVRAGGAWRDHFALGGTSALDSARVFLIDPQGYLMMFYEPEFEPSAMLKDLKRLLKTSRLG